MRRLVFSGALVLSLFFLLGGASRASAQVRFQGEFDVNPGPWFGTTARVGALFSERFALETGFGVRTPLGEPKREAYNQSTYYSVPLEAVVYFGDGKSQAIVPSLRLATSYGYLGSESAYEDPNAGTTTKQESHVHMLGAAVLGGVTYFVNDAFGITGQYGLAYTKSIKSEDGVGGFSIDPQTLNSEVRVGFAMRL